MILTYTLEGNLTVPDGTKFSENFQKIILPCGKLLKLWGAVEDNNEGVDLTEAELNALGVETGLEFHREMELSDD